MKERQIQGNTDKEKEEKRARETEIKRDIEKKRQRDKRKKQISNQRGWTEGRSQWIEQKGMTFDYDFGYSFLLFSSLLKKE